MSSNPAPGAKEYLISLFDDNRKKVCTVGNRPLAK